MSTPTTDIEQRRIGFSTRLRQLLMQHGHVIIPAQLAREFKFASSMGATAQTFSNWLNGVQLPLPATTNALAKWLHTTSDFLLNGVQVLHFAPGKDTAPADPDIDILVAQFHTLDAYGKRVAKTMMAGLARLQAGAI